MKLLLIVNNLLLCNDMSGLNNMKIRPGGTNSSLWQRNVRQMKAERNHYFERLKRKALSGQRPVKTADCHR